MQRGVKIETNWIAPNTKQLSFSVEGALRNVDVISQQNHYHAICRKNGEKVVYCETTVMKRVNSNNFKLKIVF